MSSELLQNRDYSYAAITYPVGFNSDPRNLAGFFHLAEHLLGERLSRRGTHGGQYDAASQGIFLSGKTYPYSTQFQLSAPECQLESVLQEITIFQDRCIETEEVLHALDILDLEGAESRFRNGGRKEKWVEIRNQRLQDWDASHDGFGYSTTSLRQLSCGEINSKLKNHFFPSARNIAVVHGVRQEFPEFEYMSRVMATPPNMIPTQHTQPVYLSEGNSWMVEFEIQGLNYGLELHLKYLIICEIFKLSAAEIQSIRFIDISLGHFGPWVSGEVDQLVFVFGQSHDFRDVSNEITRILAVANSSFENFFVKASEIVLESCLNVDVDPVAATACLGQLQAAGVVTQQQKGLTFFKLIRQSFQRIESIDVKTSLEELTASIASQFQSRS